jgi:hypothetical protein
MGEAQRADRFDGHGLAAFAHPTAVLTTNRRMGEAQRAHRIDGSAFGLTHPSSYGATGFNSDPMSEPLKP